MKTKHLNTVFTVVVFAFSLSFLQACNDDNNNEDFGSEPNTKRLSDADKAVLLFMLEEEKLARDIYIFLDNL
ncbi:hypothetical protein GSB9_02264 [Flavobacteriaceae bacterium GSB9]|nr:hypothetical protein GSB9_02264 [Flavobacteriaceae bacterium GSB9]